MAERAQGRTEEPTPRRLAEARRQGDVAISAELAGAIGLSAAGLVLLAGAAAGAGQLAGTLRATLAGAAAGPAPGEVLGLGLRQAMALLVLPLGTAALATLVAGLVQTGGLFSVSPLRWQGSRNAPSLARIFSIEALGAAGWGLLRWAVVALVAGLSLWALLRPLVSLTGATAGQTLAAVGVVSARVGGRLAVVLLALGVIDLLWRRARHRQALRMTRAEVARERREHEGDPHHRAERRRVHRALGEQPEPLEVRQGDFVVTGSEQAIVLRYQAGGPLAPVVVAAARGPEVVHLLERAREAGLPAFEDATLATALAAVEPGWQIPAVLFPAVAEIVQVMLSRSGAKS